MPKINVMPKHIWELIAAGEVVERPASAVKELLENSIDAGASSITVEIKNGGITYIRVTDNGCGIAREDIRNAFVSHATSKVTDADSLNAIFTLGFRGEALASIAAVSKAEMLTRTADDEIGTRYLVEYGEEKLIDDAGCPIGTTVTIRDLFSKTPARMKFLKKDVTEANMVSAVVDRIALSHPEISFRFIRDGKQTLLTTGGNDLLACAGEVLGRDFAQSLIPCSGEYGPVKVEGYISKPAFSRPNRNMQFFFVNGRYVRTGTGSAALNEAYKHSIMVGKFPCCVLRISLAFSSVDVNVHPAKTEIRFTDEKPVFNAVYAACRQALERGDTPGRIVTPSKNTEQLEEIYTRKTTESAGQYRFAQPKKDFWQSVDLKAGNTPAEKTHDRSEEKPTARPAETPPAPKVSTTVTARAPEEEIPADDERIDSIDDILLSSPGKKPAEETAPAVTAEPVLPKDPSEFDEERFRYIGEAFKTYIICEYDKKLVFIDKHAAHERMIYEKLRKESGERTPQILLTPVTVTLTKEEYAAVTENLDIINSAGFEAEDFGTGSVIIRECPMELSPDDLPDVIAEIAGRFVEKKQDVQFEKMDWIFHSVACRSAIKAGDNASRFELENFAKKLLSMPDIRYCPHGRPVLLEMTERELEKNFGRV